MSTLRVSNIEAKADASSPTIDEKVKVTSSQGRVLVQIDGKTAGITSIGINTTGTSFTIDRNQNVQFAGIITAVNLNTTGVTTFSSGIVVAAGSTAAPSISPSGDSNTGIFFPSADTVAIAEGGVEALRVDSSGNIGIGSTNPSATIDIRTAPQWSSANYGADLVIGGSRNNALGLLDSNGGNPWAIANTGGTLSVSTMPALGNTSTLPTARMQIDSSGRVTTPSQPMFSAYRNTTQSITANTSVKILLDATEFNIGNYFDTSTSRFTAPVTGAYLFTGAIQYGVNGSPHANFFKNGASFVDGWVDFGSGAMSSTQSRVMYLTAGDYIELYAYHTANTTVGQRTRMTGFLVG